MPLSTYAKSTTLLAALAASSLALAVQAPKVDPCKLLSDAEVRAVFPGAKSGVAEHSTDEYGIVSCIWNHPGGRLAVQVTASGTETPEGAARGMAMGYLDPMKGSLEKTVRVDRIDAGDGAVAIVEARDEKAGVLTDTALAVVKRGALQLRLQSSALGARPRAEGVKALQSLAQAAARRV